MSKKIMQYILKILKKINDDDIFSLSAQFSYYIILGIFPFIILVISIFRYYGSYFYYILNTAKSVIPADVYNVLLNIINDSSISYNKPYMSVSIIALLWAASSGSVGIIKGINKALNYPIKKNYFFLRLKGIFFTLGLMLSLQIIFIFIVAGRQLILFLQSISISDKIIFNIINSIRYTMSLGSIFIAFSLAYKYLPYKKVSFRFIFPGALFSTFGCIIGSLIFSEYTNRRLMYFNNIYGSLSGIFVFIIWIYMSSLIFLLGAELNVFINSKSANKK